MGSWRFLRFLVGWVSLGCARGYSSNPGTMLRNVRDIRAGAGCSYPLRFVFVLVELLVAVDGKRPNSPGTAYLWARVAVNLAVIVKMWP